MLINILMLIVVYYDVDVGIDVDGSPLEISNSFLIFHIKQHT